MEVKKNIIITITLFIITCSIRWINNNYIQFISFSLFLFFLLYFLSSIWVSKNKSLLILILSGLIFRILMIVASIFFPGLLMQSDAEGYQATGVIILNQWLKGNIFFIQGGGASGKLQFLYYAYNALVFLIFGVNPLIIRALNSFLGVIGGLILYDLVNTLANKNSSRYALFLYLFFPSIAYWQTMNLKEAAIVLFILIAVYHLVKFYRNSVLHHAFIAGMAGIVLSMLRIYLGLLIIFVVLLLFLISGKIKNKVKIILSSFILAMVAVLTWIQGYGIFGTKLLSIYTLKQMDINRRQAYSGGSQVLSEYSTASLQQLFLFIPIASIYFWFSPFVWQWGNLPNTFAKLASIENLVVAIIFIFLFIPGLVKLIKVKTGETLIILFLLAAISFVYIISYGNMGLGLRMRDQLIPLAIIICSQSANELKCIGLFRRFERR